MFVIHNTNLQGQANAHDRLVYLFRNNRFFPFASDMADDFILISLTTKQNITINDGEDTSIYFYLYLWQIVNILCVLSKHVDPASFPGAWTMCACK